MKQIQLWAWTLVALFCSAGPGGAEQTNRASLDYKKSAGPCAVDILRYDWVDPKRDRKVPVKIYFPKTGDGPFPVVVFSHGLGGSREGYEYLGRDWASHGYVSVHVQHLGSDNAVWENTAPDKIMGKMRSSAANLQNAINRPKDVTFVIDQLEKLNREERPLKQRLDLDHLGVAGYSFGAFTTLAIAGQTFPGAAQTSLADPRVKAVIAMSSPVPSAKARLDEAFRSIKIPCLHMTGTKDYSPIGETKPEDRRLPFDHINGPDQFLIIFKDGDHMIFSGGGRMSGGQKDELFQAYIRMSSIAFWDAYLKKDAKAKAWLAGGDFKKTLDQDGTFEMKLH